MELVLNIRTLGTGANGGNGEDARGADAGGLSWAVRLAFAVAAVGAAWFIMNDGQFSDIAAQILGRAHSTALPGPLGTLFAALPG
ncbi:MAG: hypothetical protein WDM94_15790 [Bauldia sp.]